eukprot:EG_transcript_6578
MSSGYRSGLGPAAPVTFRSGRSFAPQSASTRTPSNSSHRSTDGPLRRSSNDRGVSQYTTAPAQPEGAPASHYVAFRPSAVSSAASAAPAWEAGSASSRGTPRSSGSRALSGDFDQPGSSFTARSAETPRVGVGLPKYSTTAAPAPSAGNRRLSTQQGEKSGPSRRPPGSSRRLSDAESYGSSGYSSEDRASDDTQRLSRLLAAREEEVAKLRADNALLTANLAQAQARGAVYGGHGASAPPSPWRGKGEGRGGLHLKLPNVDVDEVRRHAVLGGNGSVFRASIGGFTVALKVISLRDPKAAQEMEILQQLDHPNIVRYLGTHAVSPRELHVFMEYLPFSLEVFMQKLRGEGKRFKDRELFRISLEVCKGLHYLHNTAGAQIIHRDLKSKNVLVDVDTHGEIQEVKLCDFGVSRILTAGSKAETMVGTYYWMPPEILANDATPYSVEADIWSLGMVMVELTTLHNPYFENNQNWPLTKRMILAGQPPRVDPATPPRFKQLILACLRLRPEQRPSTRDIMLFLTE